MELGNSMKVVRGMQGHNGPALEAKRRLVVVSVVSVVSLY
jgi:hypothetical protein